MMQELYDVGVVGGGQLGMMLTQAAQELNLSTIVLDPSGNDCSATRVAGAASIKGNLRDRDSLFSLAEAARFLTVEIEHLDPTTLEVAALAYSRRMNPSARTIAEIQDKYYQHYILKSRGIPVAPHNGVDSRESIEDELVRSPSGLILKTRFGAYDGRGNAEINSTNNIETAVTTLQRGNPDIKLYVEHRIPFVKEVAMMVAKRALPGKNIMYPLVEMRHLRGQLREVRVPAQVNDIVRLKAGEIVDKVANSFFRGAGVFGVEMFLGEDDQLWVNETAPRVHNTGHYTIEACQTSQFRNHILAVTYQPLESAAQVYPYAGMINIIGDYAGVAEVSKLDNIFVHDYQKDPRPERKLGHVTLVGEDYEEFNHRMQTASSLLTR